MAQHHLEVEGDLTAMIVAKLHNVNCTKAKDMVTDWQALNPFRPQKQIAKPKLTVAELKRSLTGETK